MATAEAIAIAVDEGLQVTSVVLQGVIFRLLALAATAIATNSEGSDDTIIALQIRG